MSPPTGAPRPVTPRSSSPTLIPDYTDDLPTTTALDAGVVAEAKSRAMATEEDDAATVLMTAEMGGEVKVVQPARPSPKPAIAASEPGSQPRSAGSPASAGRAGIAPKASAARSPVAVASTGLAATSPSSDAWAEEPKPRSYLGLFFGLGCMVFLVGGAGLGGGLWFLRNELASLFSDLGGTAGAEAEGTTVANPDPGAAAPPPSNSTAASAPPPNGPVIRFLSADPNTAKVNVRCDAENAKGTIEAVVSASSAKTCTVTAILTDRSRLSSVVTDPTEGVYRCFASGSKDCVRE